MQKPTPIVYLESRPNLLPDTVFQLYQYVCIQNTTEVSNTGIMVEDGCYEFMFVKENDVQIQFGAADPQPLPSVFSLNKVPLPYRFVFDKSLTLFTMKLQPWVASFFFSFSEREPVIDHNDLHNGGMIKLQQLIFATESFAEMGQRAESYFSTKPLPDLADFNLSRKICELINAAKGDISIKEMIAKFPEYRQKVNNRFLQQTNCSIKEFATYTRVRAVLNYKIKHPTESLTSIGLRFGYYDQSHFIKDIKKATGITPSQFFANSNLFSHQIK